MDLPGKKSKRVAIENSLRLNTRGTPAAAAELVLLIFYKKHYFKIPDLVHRPSAAPIAALDELTRFRLDDDLRAIWQRQKPTIIFVTHSVTEAAYLAERALVIRAGSLHAEIKIERPKKHTDNFRAAPNFHAACAAISQALADPKEGTS